MEIESLLTVLGYTITVFAFGIAIGKHIKK